MHFYDGPRLTKDVDVIASATLPIEAERKLGFGGDRYRVSVGKIKVPLGWIVRNDAKPVCSTKKHWKKPTNCQTAYQ